MATVEQVIKRLKSEKEHLARERDEDIRDIDLMIKSGGERAKRKARRRYFEYVEVIDYTLTFLRSEEEEPCPD
jgi:hypothetical protein